MLERLQKVLARWGVASRRHSEDLIRSGLILVNGHVAHVGDQVDPEVDQITYQGKLLNPQAPPQLVYLLMNKPAGVVSTCQDPQQRPTVLELLPEQWRLIPGLHPVGRLDFATTGALILTNDGDLTFQLTHPRHHFPKTYQAWVKGQPNADTLHQWRSGIDLDGQWTQPAQVQVVQTDTTRSRKTLLEIKMTEGRNRQIRRVAAQLGHPVIHLHRHAIGPISLDTVNPNHRLAPGQVRQLTNKEITALRHNRYNPDEEHHGGD